MYFYGEEKEKKSYIFLLGYGMLNTVFLTMNFEIDNWLIDYKSL